MSVKVKDNSQAIMNNLKVKATVFLRIAAEEVVKIAQPNTPKKEGNLRKDILRQVLGLKAKIVWHKTYASKMEAVQFVNYTTPGTGPHFAEDAIKYVVKHSAEIAKKSGITGLLV